MNISMKSRRALRSILALALLGGLSTPVFADQPCLVWDPAANGGQGGWVESAAGTDLGNEHGTENTTCTWASSAYGWANNATDTAASAFGSNNTANEFHSNAFGSDNTASGEYSNAFGSNNTASAHFSSAFGYHGTATGRGSIVVSGWFDRNGDGFPDAASETSAASGIGAVAVGAGVMALGDFSAAFGVNAQAQATNSTAIGFGAVATEANTIAVGATDGTMNRIVNMADGVDAHDAVNLSQLQAAITTSNAYTDTAVATGGTAANAYTDNREAAIRSDMGAGDAATLATSKSYTDTRSTQTLASANTYTDNKFASWNDSFTQYQQQTDLRFRQTEARIDRSGAMQTAMAQMTASAAGVRTINRVAVGMGAQNGRAALAVGYQRAIGDKAAFTLGGAFSGDESSAGVGYGFGW